MGMNLLRCPKCGFQFDIKYSRAMMCGSCNLSILGDCGYAICPKCGYEFSVKSSFRSSTDRWSLG
ncbi:MAG: hypothetical protein DRJ49_03050 [Thermoprotei archaeon]|nr:MAG: hypothetical protein DRJ49_03050 [Thermoprotei archaeon]